MSGKSSDALIDSMDSVSSLAKCPKSEMQSTHVLCTSGSEAPLLPFSVDAKIQKWLDPNVETGRTMEQTSRWVEQAESALHNWILNRLLSDDTCISKFRELGRGWIFVFIVRKLRKFKWWFEPVDSALTNHSFELKQLNMDEETLGRYLHYDCEHELVFLTKGLVPLSSSPTICIQCLCAPRCETSRRWWATVQMGTPQAAIEDAKPSGEMYGSSDGPGEIAGHERMRASNGEFESLLIRFKKDLSS